MRVLILAFLLLLPFVPVGHAATGSNGGMLVAGNNQDISWAFPTVAAGIVQFDIVLQRFRDLNGDGDFGDAGETETVISLPDVINCAGNDHLSCTLTTAQNAFNFITFRNSSAEHITGNYSMQVEEENAIGNNIEVHSWGFRLSDPGVLTSDVTNTQTQIQKSILSNENNATIRIQRAENNLSANVSLEGGLRQANVTWSIQRSEGNLTTNATGIVGRAENNLTGNLTQLRSVSVEVVDEYLNDTSIPFDFGPLQGNPFASVDSWQVILSELRDLNDDGDFEDPGESTAITNRVFASSETSCASHAPTATHLACAASTARTPRYVFVTWKAHAASHDQGNYSLQVYLLDGATIVSSGLASIHLLPARAPGDMTNTNIITNPIDPLTTTIQYLLVLSFLLGLATFMAARNNEFVLPIVGCFLALGLLAFKFLHMDMFGNELLDSIYAYVPLIPMVVGGFNAQENRPRGNRSRG